MPAPPATLLKPQRNPEFDGKKFFRHLDALFASLESDRPLIDVVGGIIRSIVDDGTVPVFGGRVWEREGPDYALRTQVGGRKLLPEGLSIPSTEPAIASVRETGIRFGIPGDPDYNPRLEASLGVEVYAAFVVGESDRYLISLDIDLKGVDGAESGESRDREHILTFLEILRRAIAARVREESYQHSMQEAREIQLSILPRTFPAFLDYDVYATSVPAESEKVGGDLFEFVPIGQDGLAVVIADASGHGLPASIMARDVHIALHMGIAMELKMGPMVSRVNRILCKNSLNGRFVTMFYGEIDRLHQLIYTSAGHPGLAFGGGRFTVLREGGPILGVNAGASYTRGTYSIGPKDVICLFTDGISEAQGPSGELFGEERIREYIRANRKASARELVEGVMAEVERFSEGRQDDDRTIVVVRRKPGAVAADGQSVLPIEAGFRFD